MKITLLGLLSISLVAFFGCRSAKPITTTTTTNTGGSSGGIVNTPTPSPNPVIKSASDPTTSTVATAPNTAQTSTTWKNIISPFELERMIRNDEIIVVDVRSTASYLKGHIPTAINLPGSKLRTSKAKPGAGDSQYIFRAVDGSPDIGKYEALLGQAGIRRDKTVVVYGNHGGKADGTIPAMLLNWLGQRRVAYLDGVGMDAWEGAGFEVENTPNVLPPTLYSARPSNRKFVWNLPDVLAAVQDGSATFIDTRSLGEYNGTTKRDNAQGGHIPGAVRHDSSELLDGKKCTVDQDTAREQLDALAIPADKPIVLYCQTGTRVSLNYLVLKELGYNNVAIYDASWHEYGNTPNVPIEK